MEPANEYTIPTEYTTEEQSIVNDAPPLTDSQKLELIAQQMHWLCQQVAALLMVAQSNPMVRMAMNSAQRKASK